MKGFLKNSIIFAAKIVKQFYSSRLINGLDKLCNIFLFALHYNGSYSQEDTLVMRPYRLIGSEFMQLGKEFTAMPGLRIECFNTGVPPVLSIGNHVSLGYRCHIACIRKIEIGNHVLLGSDILITDHSHGDSNYDTLAIHPTERPLISKDSIIIQDDVWIGSHSIILPGVTIGHHTIIGANTVITKDILPYSIAVGNPAQVIQSYEQK